jgi:phage anti-repressor protein
MNVLIKQEQINYQDLVANSNPDKSLYFKSRMIDELKKEFTTDEQKLFIANLYMYLHYHPTEDYPINLDETWKFIGFKNKGNAKKKLETNFVLDEDYQVALLQSQKRKNEGGHNKETVMLNVDTFKNLCIIANTPEGKRNRKYYIKLENGYNRIIQEDYLDYQRQLEEKEIELEEKEIEMDSLKEINAQLSKKRFHGVEKGDHLYLFWDDRDKVKLGKTKNLSKREGSLSTSNMFGNVVYAKKCYNADLLEKMCHHMLDKYRDKRDREWFSCSVEFATRIVDSAQLFLDGTLSDPDVVVPELYKINDILHNVLPVVPENKPEYKDMFTRRKEEEDILPEPELNANDIAIENKPTDFQKFLKDYIIIDEKEKVMKKDVLYAYKMWSNNSQVVMIRELDVFIRKNFMVKHDYYSELKSKHLTIFGMKLKTLEFKIKDSNNITDLEQFILDKCKVFYRYRVSSQTLYSAYEAWKKEKVQDYVFENATKNQLYNLLHSQFLSGWVHTADEKNNCRGFLGITLKTDKENTGIHLNKNKKKKIIQVDLETNNVLNEWDSLLELSLHFNFAVSTMCTRIKLKKVITDKDGSRSLLKYI